MRIRVTYHKNYNQKEAILVELSVDGKTWTAITLAEVAFIVEWIGVSEDFGYWQGCGRYYPKNFLIDTIDHVVDAEDYQLKREEIHSRYGLKPVSKDEVEVSEETHRKRRKFYRRKKGRERENQECF